MSYMPSTASDFADFGKGAAGAGQGLQSLSGFLTDIFGSSGSQGTSGTQKQTGTVSDVGTQAGTQTQISPEALTMIAQIFPQLFQQTTSGDYSKKAAIADSQGIVNQVMKTLQEQVLPQIYTGESARGGYSSTAKALLSNDAAARAAGQAASLVADVATKYGGVAATQQNALVNLINAAVQANKQGTSNLATTGTKTIDTTSVTDQTTEIEKEGLLNRIFGW